MFLEAVRETLQRSPEQLASRREGELHQSEFPYRVQLAFDEAR